jgi:hypothetical protein
MSITELTLTNTPEEYKGVEHFLQLTKEKPTEENLTNLYFYLRQYDTYLKTLITLRRDSIDTDLYYEYQVSSHGWGIEYFKELAGKNSLSQSEINRMNNLIDIWYDFEKEKEKNVERSSVKDLDELVKLMFELNKNLSNVF